MTYRAFAATAAMVLAGIVSSAVSAGASTIDLSLVLGNSGYESGNTSQWTVTKPNSTYLSLGSFFGVDKTIVPLDPCCSNTTLPALTAPVGDDFVGVLNPTFNGDYKGKLAHVALAHSYLAGDIFTVTIWANRGRPRSNGNDNSVFTSASPSLGVQFMGWGAGSTPTVNSSDDWSRTRAVNTTSLFTNWGDPGDWTSQTFTFTAPVNLSYISLAISGQNNNHDQYIAWDLGNADPGAPVPEPASLLLLGTGLIATSSAARRRLKK